MMLVSFNVDIGQILLYRTDDWALVVIVFSVRAQPQSALCAKAEGDEQKFTTATSTSRRKAHPKEDTGFS